MPGIKRRRDSKCPDFEESLSSKPFLFVIGEERREFHVHKDLISRLSPVLDTLVNGKMREAQENRVEWPDTAPDTFVRFAKYAYSGDYQEAKHEMLELDDVPDDANADASGAAKSSTVCDITTAAAGSSHLPPPPTAVITAHNNGIGAGAENGNGNENDEGTSGSDEDDASNTDTSEETETETETDSMDSPPPPIIINPAYVAWTGGFNEEDSSDDSSSGDEEMVGDVGNGTPSAMDEEDDDDDDDDDDGDLELDEEEHEDEDYMKERHQDEDYMKHDAVDMSEFSTLPFDLESYVCKDTHRRHKIRHNHIKRYHSSALRGPQSFGRYENVPDEEIDPWSLGVPSLLDPSIRKRRRRNYSDEQELDPILNDRTVKAMGCFYDGPPDPRGEAIRHFSRFSERLETKYIQENCEDGHNAAEQYNLSRQFPMRPSTHCCSDHSWPSSPSLSEPPDSVIPGSNTMWEPRVNLDSSECYEPVFLSHANLYILADKYAIGDLRHLTLKRLHDTLYKFDIYPNRVRDIVALTDVLFENTADDDDARLMMVDFWACISEHVSRLAVFKGLLRNHGNFASMLFERITPRLT